MVVDLQEHVCADSLGGYEPLHMLPEWVEPGTTTRRITVSILLSSGISPGRFFVRVAEGGGILYVTVTLPNF